MPPHDPHVSSVRTRRPGCSPRLATWTTPTTRPSLSYPKKKWDFPSNTPQSSPPTSSYSRLARAVEATFTIKFPKRSLLKMRETSMEWTMWRSVVLPRVSMSYGLRKRMSECLSRCIPVNSGTNRMNSWWKRDLWLKELAKELTALE